jgi:hypothetical protein
MRVRPAHPLPLHLHPADPAIAALLLLSLVIA